MTAEAPLPPETWHRVVCRLCQHPFAVLATFASEEAVDLCLVCQLLVDRFGQNEEAAAAVPAQERAPRRTASAGEEHAPADLNALWGHWQTEWQDEQHASREARQPRARRRKTTARRGDVS